MAKNNSNKLRNWICIIIGILTLAGIFAGGVMAWGNLGNKLDNHTNLQKEQLFQIVTDADDLEIKGCEPAKKNNSSINLIEYRLNEIQTTQQIIQADTKEILSRLPK